MSDDFLLYARDGDVVTLTLNDPERRNALTERSQFAEVLAALERIETDASVRCVVLTGAGKAFCAGGNVKDMHERAQSFAVPPFELRQWYRHGIQTIPLALWRLEVPVIAAVNGPAIGAGFDLTMCCDIRIAAESARFAESYARLGIIPGFGGTWLLPRLVGMSKAAEMSFTGDTVDAHDALACGLVSQVVAPDELLPAAQAMAERIAANPPHALRMIKKLLREGVHNKLDTQLEMSAAFQALAHHTLDHREALAAIFEKRDPAFKGA